MAGDARALLTHQVFPSCGFAPIAVTFKKGHA